ncbi:unnamed protein product [Rotaria sp. Silwood2]|nr:unnamed protein product [Rotaria sp. Silwood2]
MENHGMDLMNLCGIISAYSTDDRYRYSDDIHYIGGCLTAQEDYYWIKHQNRNEYWRNGSICEDYSKILCPVILIGGFADLYSDLVFHLINQLKCPERVILGPWRHQWPDDAYPGPKIGFLQEIIEWLDLIIYEIVFLLSPNCHCLQLHSTEQLFKNIISCYLMLSGVALSRVIGQLPNNSKAIAQAFFDNDINCPMLKNN